MDHKERQHSSKDGSFSSDVLWQWIRVVCFAVAFAWVESAVVVYLREIYFEGSFSFPLVFEWDDAKFVMDLFLRIELGREAATIVMLVMAGWIAARMPLVRFSYFMIAFGVWDIFYYVWLWVMIRWPESLMTWDLLFAIPLPWVGPVIAPVLISIAMIVAGSLIVFYMSQGCRIAWRWYDWAVELIMALLMIVAFCWDWKNIMRLPDGVTRSGLPNPFAWWLFGPAYAGAVCYFFFRLRKIVQNGLSPK